MFGVSVSGAQELQSRLDAYPSALRAELAAKADALSRGLADKVTNEKLDGGVLVTRSGALKASIAAEISGSGDYVAASVGSFGGVKYAAIQEYGGRTAAHEILPDKASVLAFAVNNHRLKPVASGYG